METAPEPLAVDRTSTEPLLVVKDLVTTFTTTRGPVRAVDGVSFELRRGETLGIVGESGSGKSVLVRSIMNLLASNATVSDGSQILFEGRDVRHLPASEARHFWGMKMAMIFQDPMTSLNPVKRVGAQLREAMRFHLGLSRREATERAVDLLDQVRVPEPRRRLEQYPHELSGGMRQRVMIAIALACDPLLLIADEPTTALDVTVQKEILDLLNRVQAEHHMAGILITHDLGVVASQADRVAVMYAGQLVEVADTDSLFTDIRHPYTEALLNAMPKLDLPSHTKLESINGRPPDLVGLPAGCRFAPRCRYAQAECLEHDPVLAASGAPDHLVRCFQPVGSPAAISALDANTRAGRTATGLELAGAVS